MNEDFLKRLDAQTPLIASLMRVQEREKPGAIKQEVKPQEQAYMVTKSELQKHDREVVRETLKRTRRPKPRESPRFPIPLIPRSREEIPLPAQRSFRYEPRKKTRAARFQDEINQFNHALDSLI